MDASEKPSITLSPTTCTIGRTTLARVPLHPTNTPMVGASGGHLPMQMLDCQMMALETMATYVLWGGWECDGNVVGMWWECGGCGVGVCGVSEL